MTANAVNKKKPLSALVVNDVITVDKVPVVTSPIHSVGLRTASDMHLLSQCMAGGWRGVAELAARAGSRWKNWIRIFGRTSTYSNIRMILESRLK